MSDTGASPRTEAGAGRRLDDIPRPAATIAVADDESHDIGGSINDDDDEADDKRAEFRGRVEMVTSMGFDSNRVAEAFGRGDGTVTEAVDWMESHRHGEGDDGNGDEQATRPQDPPPPPQVESVAASLPPLSIRPLSRNPADTAAGGARPSPFPLPSPSPSPFPSPLPSPLPLGRRGAGAGEAFAAAGRREGGATDGAGHNADAFNAAASAAPTREADPSLDGTMSEMTPIEGYVAPSSPTPARRRAFGPSANDAAAPAAATTTPPLLDDRHVVALRHDDGRGSGGRIEGDSEANMAHRKHRPLVIAVVAVCAVVIVSLAAALPLTFLSRGVIGRGREGSNGVGHAGTERDSDSNKGGGELLGGESSLPPLSSPLSWDNIFLPRPDSVRFIALVEILTQEGVTDPDTLADRSSPQYRAAKWLADDDTNTNTTTAISLLSESGDDDNTNLSRIIIQRYVLATLFYSTGGGEGHWKEDYGFLSSASECDWRGEENFLRSQNGVRCDNDNAVSEVGLVNNNMTGNLPSELGALATIEIISASYNHISSSIPERIYDLYQMATLVLNGNSFTGTLSSGVGKLGKLVTFVITENSFTGTLPTELEEVRTLQNFQLDGNMFDGVLPSLTHDNLPNLVLFGAYDNFLVGTIPEPLPLQLQHIDLAKNRITGTIPSDIPPNISLFSLSDNNLEGEIPESLVTSSNLERLSLASNNLRGDGLSKISGLTNLKLLHLSKNSLSGTVPSSIGNLEGLAELLLSTNRFSGSLPKELGNLVSLTTLFLDENSFLSTVPATFQNLTNLRFLALDQNNFSGDLGFMCTISVKFSLFSADCSGIDSEVLCWCCTRCCNRNDRCYFN